MAAIHTLYCYVCGGAYGPTSIRKHLETCAWKWNDAQKHLPSRLQNQAPSQPKVPIPDTTLDQRAVKQWNDSALSLSRMTRNLCPYCEHGFASDKLLQHMKDCSFKPDLTRELVRTQYVEDTPVMFMCGICGREIGVDNIKSHMNMCFDDFRNDQNAIDEQYRAPLPDLEAMLKQVDQALNIAPSSQTTSSFERSFGGATLSGTGSLTVNTRDIGSPAIVQRSFGGVTQEPEIKIRASTSTPTMFVCGICGREYGTASIERHLKSCIKQFKNDQKQVEAQYRRKIPDLDTLLKQIEDIKSDGKITKAEIEAQRLSATQAWKDSLAKCQWCGRTFESDRLPAHLKGCDKRPSGVTATKPPETVKIAAAPQLFVCGICGREYGTMSIERHLKNCLEQFRNDQKAIEPQYRRKEPNLDSLLAEIAAIKEDGVISKSEIEDQRENAQKIWKDSLAQCQWCGKTFESEKLPSHLQGCSKRPKDADTLAQTSSLKKPVDPPSMFVCGICGREYGTASIERHLKSCFEQFTNDQRLVAAQYRRPIPNLDKLLDEIAQIKADGKITKQEFGDQRTSAQQYWKDNLAKCPYCGKSFESEKLASHLKGCSSRK
ncbi:MAG: putative zinc finger protein 474 [Streblomastix strix]|uniref:Putative zinc finger protein 474 n=1 Tax=Streblomastix strix TaxID=222440 RepID=A0A5J4W9W8_9EUKA|nr:MAG: putative zinc finger protein 474 [Streblomastix strix]